MTVGGLSSNALLALLGIAFLLPLLWVLFASVDADAGRGRRASRDLSLKHYRAMAHETRCGRSTTACTSPGCRR